MRLIQHKSEAFWFYRFLSVFYDKLVNPLFWTSWMRDQALELADLEEPGIKVIDVGSGTGFTTQGIVSKVNASSVTCIDQSPHQMSHAKNKKELQACNFQIGDAENIPVESNLFDRYISAGSIEYWPDPQQGINESFRVIKPGGRALMIGPLSPKTGFARFLANTWMLFPKDEEYKSWYRNAGFVDIQWKYLQPHWYKDTDGYGIAIVGTKPLNIISDKKNPARKIDEEHTSFLGYIKIALRVIIGSLAGFIFIPIALLGYLVNIFVSQTDRPARYREKLNIYQITFLIVLAIALLYFLISIF